MEFDWPEDVEAFRLEVRAFLDERITPEVQREIDSVPKYPPGEDGDPETPLLDEIVAEMVRRGWMYRSLPVEIGGGGASQWFHYVMSCEILRRGVPVEHSGMTMFAPAIRRFGTPEQQQYFIPRLFSGDVRFALAYSEPNAGTDLASLTTAARRDGDDYVISGHKKWTSDAHRSTHIWTAARTDPEAPKHKGISIFMVPADTPGLTIRPIWTMSGLRTNEVLWDNVRVPASARLGEENAGWYLMANSLDGERVFVGAMNYAEVIEVFDILLEELRRNHPDKLRDPAVRQRLAELLVDIRIQRALVLTNASIVARGEMPTKQASMVKVWGTELEFRVADVATDLVGRLGSLRKASPLAPGRGRMDAAYRHGPVHRFTAGTNEVQRDIIARRGLGLPR